MSAGVAEPDVFNAIAEPRRREILQVLARRGPREVGELVIELGVPQPQVSKHLAVLRRVGLVAVKRRGRFREYRVNAQELRTVHDWTRMFEKFWTHQLDRIKQRAEQAEKKEHP
jgi:DNA-binding transcriptional ArsR family regulator